MRALLSAYVRACTVRAAEGSSPLAHPAETTLTRAACAPDQPSAPFRSTSATASAKDAGIIPTSTQGVPRPLRTGRTRTTAPSGAPIPRRAP
ncbi:hypothetical protein ACIOUE_18220 [Streptomyces xanthochromogenes]|uniref:hypothetical protein n=1 Tax=Streptomyces xanthochromogenes TaxID=67384 RepID=UPI0037B3F9AE